MKKLNKFIKLSSATLMVGLILFSNLLTVNAATAPDSIVVDTTELGNGNNPLKLNRSFAVKKSSDGKYMYCMDYHLYSPQNTTYINKGETNNNAIAYILRQGANDKNNNDYFITQTALWIYLLDNGLMQDSSYGSIKAYKEAVYSSANDSNTAAVAIRKLIADAKKAGKEATPSLSIDKSASFTLEKDEYVSSVIKVNTTAKDYQVKLENAPSGAVAKKVNGGVVVTVPASSMQTNSANFNVVVSASQDVTSVYIYNATNASYQPVSAPYTKTVNLEDKMSLSIEATPVEETVVSIIKRDKDTNKILEGATLVLVDASGKVIDEWTTTTEAHLVYNLENGTYTITEKTAPDGYELSSEKVTFEVTENDKSKTVTFYNQKKEVPVTPDTPEEVINVPVESTGMTKGIMGSVIGLAAIASGITVIYRKTKETNK